VGGKMYLSRKRNEEIWKEKRKKQTIKQTINRKQLTKEKKNDGNEKDTLNYFDMSRSKKVCIV